MFWNEGTNPKKSGTYLTSISPTSGSANPRGFLYVAYFDAEQDAWYKIDPFKNLPSEIIGMSMIAGWCDKIAVYLG